MNSIGLVGANGFIGSSIKSSDMFSDYEIHSFTRGNPITDELAFETLVSNMNCIIWAASITNPSIAESNSDIVDLELGNWIQFLNKLSLSELPIPKLLFISSGGCVYTGSKTIFNESDEAHGSNAYGRLKLRMEQELVDSGLNHSIIRAANIYGPNQPTGRGQGVVAEWVSAAKLGLPLKLYGDAKVCRDFLYISDFLASVKLILESDAGGIVNIGSGKSEPLTALIHALRKNSPMPIDVSYFPARDFDRNSYSLDISLANEKYGWWPRVNLEEGIAKCFSSALE